MTPQRKRGKPLGSKSPGSGRRPAGDMVAKKRTVKLTDAHWTKFKQLGGPQWLRRMIEGADSCSQ